MTLPEDTILENRYRIDGVLAHGSSGAVYKAFDLNANAPVAIKENFIPTPHHKAQFTQESLILAQLRHSALPQITTHFSFEGQFYLVMNFIEGENLWQIMERRGGPLPERDALNYIVQICRAVSYLHRQKPPVLHRDIKPRNIIITPGGQAVLVDFGLGKQFVDQDSLAETGPQGTIPKFSSPEQYSGIGVSAASDIYALGATLYTLLTGQTPPNSVGRLVEETRLKLPNEINPNVTLQTAQAVVYAMHLKPEKRPRSAESWQRILENITGSMPSPSDDDQTILSPRVPAQLNNQPTVVGATPPPVIDTQYWLVDSTGVGYPLSDEALKFGRHPNMDVVISDDTVSGHHASVRIDEQRCLIFDENSTNGTYLNGHRLQSEWYPLNQGDVLVIGPARFYLTTTQPARVAQPKATPTAATRPSQPAAPVSTTQTLKPSVRSAAPPEPQRAIWPLVALLILLVIVIGAGAYFWLRPRQVTVLPAAASSQNQTATFEAQQIASTQTAEANAAQQIEQAVQLTVQAKDATATHQAEMAQAITPISGRQTPTPEAIIVPRRTTAAISQTATISATATLSATASATPKPVVRFSPTPAGPTVIPLESRVSIDRIGAQEVIDIDINPKNPKEVYALVKRDGIYKSSTGGEPPWARVDLDGSSITSLTIDPLNPATLYAPTWNAVLKSEDGGNSWDPKTEGLVANQVVDLVAVHPLNSDILYGGIGEKLVVSADGGESWTSQGYGQNLGIGRLYTIAVDPFNKGTLYVGGLAASLYKSTDSGQGFTPLVNTGQGTFSIALHPTQKDVLLAGVNSGDAAILKSDNGIGFYSVSTGLLYGGGDSAYSAITYAPSNPNIVYAGSGFESNPNTKGIFKSTDGGETWHSINNGLTINRDTGFPYYIKSIAVHPADPDIVFAATGSGLYKSTNGGELWELK